MESKDPEGLNPATAVWTFFARLSLAFAPSTDPVPGVHSSNATLPNMLRLAVSWERHKNPDMNQMRLRR